MKCLLTLSCAIALILSLQSTAHAADLRADNNAVGLYNHASADHKKLNEAKVLLEKIRTELNTPPQKPYEVVSVDETQDGILEEKTITATPLPEANAELLVSHEGDIELQCGALSEEALRMRDIIYETQDVKDRAKMQSHGITAAGAIGSFLIGSVTGGVGLAAAGFLLDQGVSAAESDADEIQDIAAQRRTLMMGIYNAKGCNGPLEHAMQNPDIFDPLSQIASAEPSSGAELPHYNKEYLA